MNYQHLYTRVQAAVMRSKIIEADIKPIVKGCFEQYPQLKSALVLVAQYWDDEANDAVHECLIFSVLETPDVEAAFRADEAGEQDAVNLPEPRSSYALRRLVEENLWSKREASEDFYWDDNGTAISAFAAFCKEGSHQGMSMREAYTPYAVLRPHGDDVEVEIVGQMLRPWLDGIKPEEWEEA